MSLINNIEELKRLKNSVEELSVYDLNVYTANELYYNIANKVNEIIKELQIHEILVSEEIIEQNNVLQEMLDSGLQNEVINKINDMVNDGTMDSIINQNLLEDLNSQIKEKSNLNNNKVVIANQPTDDSPALNVYNKNKQGTFPLGGTNAGIVLHNYTDAPALQIDNVGVNNAINVNMANNSINRPDKDSEYCGNGNFINFIQTYFDNGVKKTRNVFNISNSAEFTFYESYKYQKRIKRIDPNDGTFAEYLLCEKPQKNIFAINNGGRECYKQTYNTQDYFYNYSSNRHTIFNFGDTGQAKFNNNTTTGYSYVFNGKSADGSIFKINNNIALQIRESSTFLNAIQLKPITDDTILPINTLFMDGSGALKFKNFNGVVKTIQMV